MADNEVIWSASAKALLKARYDALVSIRATEAVMAPAHAKVQEAKNVLFAAESELKTLSNAVAGKYKDIANLAAAYKTITGSEIGNMDTRDL